MCRSTDTVGPLRPVRKLLERAALRPFGQFAVGDAARVHAGAVNADLGAVARRTAQHHFDVVVALRNLLVRLGAARRVAHQEDLQLLAGSLRKRAGQL